LPTNVINEKINKKQFLSIMAIAINAILETRTIMDITNCNVIFFPAISFTPLD
jgi:hypothetical protein